MLPDGIHAIAKFPRRMDICTDPTSSRYALAGVQVRPSGKENELYAAATNGRILAICKAEGELEPGLPDVIVPAKFAKPISKKRNPPASLNGAWTREDAAAVAIEGRFPRCESCLPYVASGEYLAVRLSAEELRNLAESIGDENGTVTLFLPNGKPFVNGAIAAYGEHGIGAIMPCELENDYQAHVEAYRTAAAEYTAAATGKPATPADSPAEGVKPAKKRRKKSEK